MSDLSTHARTLARTQKRLRTHEEKTKKKRFRFPLTLPILMVSAIVVVTLARARTRACLLAHAIARTREELTSPVVEGARMHARYRGPGTHAPHMKMRSERAGRQFFIYVVRKTICW